MLLTETSLPLDDGSFGELEAARSRGLCSTAEIAPWMMALHGNVVVNKNSSLLACYRYTGPDTEGLSHPALAGLMNEGQRMLAALADFPITLWLITDRRRVGDYDTLPMPDQWAQVVDDERLKAIAHTPHYLNTHYLCVSLAASAGLNRLWGRYQHARKHDGKSARESLTFAVKGLWSDQMVFAYTVSELEAAIEHFENLQAVLRSNLPSLSFERLADDALGEYLHACATPSTDQKGPLALMDFLDDSMPAGEIVPSQDYLWFNAHGCSRFAVMHSLPTTYKVWPDKVDPQQLAALLKVPAEITVSHVLRLQSEAESTRMIDKARQYHDSRKLNLKGMLSLAMNKGDPNFVAREDRGREEAAEEAEDLKGDVSRGRKVYGQYSMAVAAYSPRVENSANRIAWAIGQAQKASKLVRDAMAKSKLGVVMETVGALSAWTATLPGAWREIARWTPISHKVFARMVPLQTVAVGSRINPHLSKEMHIRAPALAAIATDYGTPYFWTGFYDDIGHTLVCGETGFGKTTIVNLAWTLFRKYPHAEVFLFDRDYSSYIPVMMQYGLYFDPTADVASATINPISLIGEDRHLEYVKNWIALLAARRGYAATTDDTITLEKALLQVRQLDRADWRLSAVHVHLPIGPLSNALAEWVGESISAKWFDNTTDLFEDIDRTGGEFATLIKGGASRPIGIETNAILKQPSVAIPFLDYCFYRIYDRIEQRIKKGAIGPTFIGLPEVWNYLADPMFAKQLAEWIDTLRKKLGCVWMDAQSPERFINSPIYPSIRDNVPNRIILPYPAAASSPSLGAALEEFGLNSAQIQTIAQGVKKRDYFLNTKNGFLRRLALSLDTRTMAVLRSEASARAVFNKWLNSGRQDWREQYFIEMTQ